jgi:oligogalacturonide transporter
LESFHHLTPQCRLGLGIFIMGLVFGVFYALPWLAVFLGTSRHRSMSVSSSRENPFRQFYSVLKNRSFRHHAGLFISSQMAVDMLSALFPYYIASVIFKEQWNSAILGMLLIVPIFAIPIYIRISKKHQKTTPMHFGMLIWAAALISTLFISAENWQLTFLVAMLSGIGTSAAVFVPWTILPEVTDADELISGRRREGVYGGVATFLRKFAGGASILILGWFLEIIGYIPPDQMQELGISTLSSRSIFGMQLTFALLPTVLILTAYYFSKKYCITRKRHEVLMTEIARLKDGGSKKDVSLETRAVCEEICGIPYERLWSKEA